MQLKTIDLAQKSFTANSREYFIETNISIHRSVYAEAAKIELETGLQAGKWTEDWVKIFTLANEQKFADIVVLAYNNRRGFRNFFEQHHPVLKLCACFMNLKDEDRRTITDDDVDRKINDWAEEGITMQSFFCVALSILRIEAENYASGTQAISELIKEFNQKVSQETTDIHISN